MLLNGLQKFNFRIYLKEDQTNIFQNNIQDVNLDFTKKEISLQVFETMAGEIYPIIENLPQNQLSLEAANNFRFIFNGLQITDWRTSFSYTHNEMVSYDLTITYEDVVQVRTFI